MKMKLSQAQNNWFVFKETPVYKKGVRGCVRKEQCTVMLWEFFLLYLSLVKVIPETKSI